MTRLSFNSWRRPQKISIELETMPAADNPRSTHLSGRDAWRIKLSKQASRKKTNSTSHADIQYRVTECLIINVRHIPEMVHSSALKINGGSTNINWKRFNTITTADRAGCFN